MVPSGTDEPAASMSNSDGNSPETYRLVAVSHAFVQDIVQSRWRLLAQRHPVEVHLLVPELWRTGWLGSEQEFRPPEVHDGRFHVHPLPTTDRRDWGRYLFRSRDALLRTLRPHLMYVIHEEMMLIHLQLLLYRRLWSARTKYAFFSMHALGVPRRKWHQRVRWWAVRRGADAALCHYPGCLRSLREGGYSKPVFLQTQVGVNEAVFRPNRAEREAVRRELGLEDRFVIGYAGRLTRAKGVLDLMDALPLQGVDWGLILVGDGDAREEIERRVSDNGWQDRVHLTGLVPKPEVARYLRALDCFVLGSRTMPDWIDTFPLVTVQAMACEVPVIGSDSGAIPWQLGDTGLVFPEGDATTLRHHIEALASDPGERARLARAGRERSLGNFCITGMTDRFYDIMKQIISGDFRHQLPDSDQRKAYLP